MWSIKQGRDLHLILNVENVAMAVKTSRYRRQIWGEYLIEYTVSNYQPVGRRCLINKSLSHCGNLIQQPTLKRLISLRFL